MSRGRQSFGIESRGLVRRAGAVTVIVLGIVCLASSAAAADTLQISVQTLIPEQGVPVSLQFSGAAGAIDNSGDGPYLYAVVRPTGGVGCQPSFGSDQAAAGPASTNLFDESEVSVGSVAQQTTYNPPDVGSYLLCAWLENNGDSGDFPLPSSDVTGGPVSATFSARPPQVSEFNVALAGSALRNVAYQISYTTQTDQQLGLYSVVKFAGALPCASSYELEQQQNQTENDIFGTDTTVFGGPTKTTGTDTETTAGSYIICAWIEGPNGAEVDAASSTAIHVGTVSPRRLKKQDEQGRICG